ncbi:hypothetical protein, partial [Escherichia coli]|uniref:hypothetical protein n=1 Tax=Escherichia coli TaxID=562 RepID=UPI001A8E8B1C
MDYRPAMFLAVYYRLMWLLSESPVECYILSVYFPQARHLRKRKLTAVCSHQTRIGNLDAHLTQTD